MFESTANYFESSLMFHGSMSIVMGTRFDIILVGEQEERSKQIWGEICSELKRLDKMFNRFDTQSEVSKINSQAVLNPIIVSSEMWEILLDCQKYHSLTLGLFDITRKDFSRVKLDVSNNTVFFNSSDTSIDFGGYAKGYAMNQIQKVLVEFNAQQVFVDFGNSSLLAIGNHPYGDSWKVSIDNPFKKGEILSELKLKDHVLSTSGNMPSHPKHIINPLTGKYNEERKMVAVVTNNSIEAEVLSTSLMIANADEKRKIVNQFDNIENIMIFNL